MAPPEPTKTDRALQRHLIMIGLSFVLLFGGVVTLGASIEMSGAVVASGHLVVESELKKVQHPTGGVVSELLVQNGARVTAGDVLVRLDPTVAGATLSAVTKDLFELAARRARLEAERDGEERVTFPPDLLEGASDPIVRHIVSGEQRLFGFRQEALKGQKAQLRERISQLRLEIGGLEGQIRAKTSEIELVGRELDGVRDLWKKNLIQLTRLTGLEREAARLGGEAGKLEANMAEVHGKIAETELQVIQLDQSMRSETSKELADIRQKTSELTEKKVTALDQLTRVELRAPQSGVVHQLSVHTEGGVVAAGEQLMLIVPDSDALIVELRILPRDIDQVRVGQKVVLRFANFNQRTTPEIDGEVSRVSADVADDDRTDQPYYLVRARITDVARLGDVTLTPGMPVDAFVRTGERTMLSYLTKPLVDQASRAFREK